MPIRTQRDALNLSSTIQFQESVERLNSHIVAMVVDIITTKFVEDHYSEIVKALDVNVIREAIIKAVVDEIATRMVKAL